jgi:hypothetical protein
MHPSLKRLFREEILNETFRTIYAISTPFTEYGLKLCNTNESIKFRALPVRQRRSRITIGRLSRCSSRTRTGGVFSKVPIALCATSCRKNIYTKRWDITKKSSSQGAQYSRPGRNEE